MKIVVYNHQYQYGLSRAQVETIRGLLPTLFEPIQEFHLSYGRPNPEIFEYDRKSRVVYFCLLVKQKSPEIVARAVEELLIGVARIKAKSRFGVPLSSKEREEYLPFVQEWHKACLEAIGK